MTGVGPAELLAGGREFFDTLVERAAERRRLGYESTELLALLVEMTFANHRALVALGGGKPPAPIKVERPGQPSEDSRPPRVSWRELAARVRGGGRG